MSGGVQGSRLGQAHPCHVVLWGIRDVGLQLRALGGRRPDTRLKRGPRAGQGAGQGVRAVSPDRWLMSGQVGVDGEARAAGSREGSGPLCAQN